MNLLPIPALDGGHVMFYCMKLSAAKKPSDKFLENAQMVGFLYYLYHCCYLLMETIFTKQLK
jgi:regulator of sigma E protease